MHRNLPRWCDSHHPTDSPNYHGSLSQPESHLHCSMRERSVPTFFFAKGLEARYGDSRCRDDIVVVVI